MAKRPVEIDIQFPKFSSVSDGDSCGGCLWWVLFFVMCLLFAL